MRKQCLSAFLKIGLGICSANFENGVILQNDLEKYFPRARQRPRGAAGGGAGVSFKSIFENLALFSKSIENMPSSIFKTALKHCFSKHIIS